MEKNHDRTKNVRQQQQQWQCNREASVLGFLSVKYQIQHTQKTFCIHWHRSGAGKEKENKLQYYSNTCPVINN